MKAKLSSTEYQSSLSSLAAMKRKRIRAKRLASGVVIAAFMLSGCVAPSARLDLPEPIVVDLEQTASVSTNPLMLRDGIRLGILNSNNVLTSDILIRQTKNETVIARAAYFPELFLEVSPGNESNSIGLGGAGFRYTVFDFGARAAQLNAANAGILRASFEQIAETEEAAVEVANAYIDFVIDRDQVQASEDYLVAVRDLQEAVRSRVEVGVASAVEEREIESGLIAANIEVVRSKSRTEASLASLMSIVGVNVASAESSVALGRLFNVIEAPLPVDLSAFAQYAALEAQVQEAQHALEAQQSRLRPQIGVRVGVGVGLDLDQGVVNNGIIAGPEISNTFDLGGARAARVENAKFDVAIAKQALEAEERALRLRYNNARIELSSTLRRIGSQRKIIALSRERRDIMKNEYEIGSRDLRDLIQIEDLIHGALLELNETYRDNLHAQVNMLIASNLLSERLFGIAERT